MNKKKLYIVIAVVLAAALIVEILFAHPHYHEWWHTMPGFDILFGVVGCSVLIIVAKKIVGPILQRNENYYDGGEDDE